MLVKNFQDLISYFHNGTFFILVKIDHDECKGNVHGCEQHCINLPGGYTCSCLSGYRLNTEDAKTCDGIVYEIVRINSKSMHAVLF